MGINDQQQLEQNVFRDFAKICPLILNLKTLCSRPEPEPDLTCQLMTGELLAFELTQNIDPKYAQRMKYFFHQRKVIDTAVDKLADDDKRRLDEVLAWSNIYLTPNWVGTNKGREKALPSALKFLTSSNSAHDNLIQKCKIKYTGKIAKSWLSGTIRRKTTPSCMSGDIQIFCGGGVGDSLNSNIKRKCSKKYVTDHPIHLLVYYDIPQDGMPKEWFANGISDEIHKTIEHSHFEACWVFERQSGELLHGP